MVLRPGHATLADWRAIYRGARVTLDPACHAAIADGARAVEAILASGEPVYGINTGFGQLASVRIAAADLMQAATQHRAVARRRRRRADACALVRLMLALKLASLAQGASGARPETVHVPVGDVVARPVAGGADAGFRRCIG